MKNKTEKRTTKRNVVKNDLTGKEATIRRDGSRTIIVDQPKTGPKAETKNSAATHTATETKPEAKPKAEPKAKAKAKPKAKKEASPLRKITLSRTTMQLTIPSEERDVALKSLNIKLEDLKAKRSLTVWDNEIGALVTRIVKAEEGQ